MNTLIDLRSRHFFKAPHGSPGGGKDCTGKKGADLNIPVPVGTVVHDKHSGDLIGDIIKAEQTMLVAHGGSYGLGNAHFKSATNRTPRQSTPGVLGEERDLALELKLLADVGLVGLPNAGKSTLLNAVSAAHPKIADYPFTTLVPMLGVVSVGAWQSFVMADLPGLIAGAARGAGLGFQFLRHIQRTRLLLHIVDIGTASVDEAVLAVRTIEEELAKSSTDLSKYPRWLVGTKTDLMVDAEAAAIQKRLVSALDWAHPVFMVSAVSGKGLRPLIESIMVYLDDEQNSAQN